MAENYPVQYTPLSEYSQMFSRIKLTRENGVLLVQFHKDDGEFSWSWEAHTQVSRLWNYLAFDPETRVIVMTGTGANYLTQFDPRKEGQDTLAGNDPQAWGLRQQQSRRMLMDLLEIEQPIIAALNGSVNIHSQIPLLADIIIATPDTEIGETHIPYTLPGDGHHVVWPLVMGMNRAKYLLLTDQAIGVQKLHEIGVVSEIIERDQLLARAMELANNLVKADYIALRHFRTITTQRVKREMLDDLNTGLYAQGYGLLRKVADTPGGRFGALSTTLADWKAEDQPAAD